MFSLVISNQAFAQEVEHNYLVGPQFTNCDSLEVNELSPEKKIDAIRTSKFRFDQSFNLTRRQGLQGGEYYSCDNQVGFLVITYNGEEFLYEGVEKATWNNLISSSDPESEFLRIKKAFNQQ